MLSVPPACHRGWRPLQISPKEVGQHPISLWKEEKDTGLIVWYHTARQWQRCWEASPGLGQWGFYGVSLQASSCLQPSHLPATVTAGKQFAAAAAWLFTASACFKAVQ